MAPLSKGGCRDFSHDWGIVAVHRTAFERAFSLQSLRHSLALCRLPLHKGGYRLPTVCTKIYRLLTPHPSRRKAAPPFSPEDGPLLSATPAFPPHAGESPRRGRLAEDLLSTKFVRYLAAGASLPLTREVDFCAAKKMEGERKYRPLLVL